MDPKEEPIKPVEEVKLEHRHLYIGGPFAYKNSSKSGSILNPENFEESIMMLDYGKARKIKIAVSDKDPRAGTFPQHNSPDEYKTDLELIDSKLLEPYAHMSTLNQLKESGFEHRIASMTRERLRRISKQFSHLSEFTFNQMMDIPTADKRDFDIWCKMLPKHHQVLIAYPKSKTEQTIFAQVLQYDEQGRITGIKHCSFDKGAPMVINETRIDSFGNIRQMAHLGKKGGSDAANSVERFDDGTVLWTITHRGETGTAALKSNDEIVFVANQINDAAKLAAQNLGAELIKNNKWVPGFSIEACQPGGHPMQTTFKTKMREQISQIIDGAMIPGLEPIFRIPLENTESEPT
jgi:hypothetical protein